MTQVARGAALRLSEFMSATGAQLSAAAAAAAALPMLSFQSSSVMRCTPLYDRCCGAYYCGE